MYSWWQNQISSFDLDKSKQMLVKKGRKLEKDKCDYYHLWIHKLEYKHMN